MWRYNPGFQAIAEAVRQGWLGEVIQVRAFMGNNLSPSQRASWAEFDGGSMFEQGAHLVDATVRLLGSPARVTPFLRNHGTMEDRLRDNNVTVLEFERATAVITNTALQVAGTPHRSFEVIATNGTALLLPVEPPTLVIELASAAGPYHKGKQSVAMPVYERYVGDFAELAAAVRGEKPLTVSLDEELLVAQTVLRAAGMA
jgi:predicted dehydrogenase